LQKIKNLLKETGMMSIGITLSLVVFVGLSVANGWTEPTVAPPSGNVGAPLNTGALGQSKIGGLVLNTGGAANGLIVQNGRVGIGTTSPQQSLDVNGILRVSSDGVGGRIYGANPGQSNWTGKELVLTVADGAGTNNDGIWIGPNVSNAGGGKGWVRLHANRIAMTGNDLMVGIGTTSPSSGLKLDVEGKVGATEYCDQNGQNCKSITSMGSAGSMDCTTQTISNNKTTSLSVNCPAGRVSTGGGCACTSGNSVRSSRPNGTNGWSCSCGGDAQMSVYAMCCK
ncbi:MAG: hypothetical protein Q8L10_05705, partial [Candidatus Moranbacteria bacterium]|nr:hypothetical protein [Candidatus Moranbacteria bacterium]